MCSRAGIQFAGSHLQEVQKALKHPTSNLGFILEQGTKRAKRIVGLSTVNSLSGYFHPNLQNSASLVSKSVN